jgi:hypothetical protein
VKYRERYPVNWEQLAWEAKQRAGWICESCGIAHGSQLVSERTGVVYTVYLAACHVNHDPWNPMPELRVWCPACHMRYDYSYRERQRRMELERMRHRALLQRGWNVYG